MVTIPVTFLLLLIISSSLIYFGSRNDAVSIAKSLKSGVLMADEINIAFQNIGGKLIQRNAQESQLVQKGDILMILDDVDTNIAIERIKAVISAQEALIRQEETSIRIEESETNLIEMTTWRKIEETQAHLDAIRATQELANIEFDRHLNLSKTGGVSQSIFDSVKNTQTKASMDVVQTESQLASLMIGTTHEQREKFNQTKRADGMTLQTIINARERILNRQNQLAQLSAQLVQSKAELKQLEVNYQRLTLIAPEAGKILRVLYDEGEMIPVGAPVVILETDRKYVDIYVNENMVSSYDPGTTVNAYIPALNANTKGVVRFATVASSFADLRTTRERGQADLISFQVRIYVEETAKLLAGMTIEVDDAQQH